MARYFIFPTFLISAIFGSTLASANEFEAIERYLEGARAIVQDLEQDDPNEAMVIAKVSSILEDAKPAMLAFAKKRSHCTEEVQVLISLYSEINHWHPATIHNAIENGEALPNGGCFIPRTVVARPAMVRYVARQGITAANRESLKRDMNRGIVSMEQVALLLAPDPWL